jgi:hypothetical protein
MNGEQKCLGDDLGLFQVQSQKWPEDREMQGMRSEK